MFEICASFGNWAASHGNSTFQLPLEFYFFELQQTSGAQQHTAHLFFSVCEPHSLLLGLWTLGSAQGQRGVISLCPGTTVPLTSQSHGLYC